MSRQNQSQEELNESLLHACYNGGVQEVDRLIDAGADINFIGKDSQGNIATPLHYAVSNDAIMASILYSGKKLDLEVRDIDGNTALHHAAYHGKIRIAEKLVAVGANIDAENNRGTTPTDFAKVEVKGYSPEDIDKSRGREEIIALFERKRYLEAEQVPVKSAPAPQPAQAGADQMQRAPERRGKE